MAKISVTYTPTDAEDASRLCTVFGLTFAPGKPEDVDEDLFYGSGESRVNVLGKLRNNGQFTVAAAKGKKAAAAEGADQSSNQAAA